jgi:hypothetical protein
VKTHLMDVHTPDGGDAAGEDPYDKNLYIWWKSSGWTYFWWGAHPHQKSWGIRIGEDPHDIDTSVEDPQDVDTSSEDPHNVDTSGEDPHYIDTSGEDPHDVDIFLTYCISAYQSTSPLVPCETRVRKHWSAGNHLIITY